jgi:drug/metabolite transporter (DMT)-like permease
MHTAIAWAILGSLCFGVALVTGRIGLRTLDARSGAAISIPSATVLLFIAAPFAFDAEGFTLLAALIFAAVGLFFPALVTILTFRSNEQLGPTITGAVSGTAPLFALLAAGLLLGEQISAQATLGCLAIVAGVAVLSWRQDAVRPGYSGRALLWPVCGAVVRGLAQAGARAGLVLWPSPFSASLLGYTVSSAVVLGTSRVGRSKRPPLTKHGARWFALTGALNGGAVLLMYGALSVAPVALVAPIVATYPLVTVLTSALVLREEPVTLRMAAGAAITVLATIYLVASRTGA